MATIRWIGAAADVKQTITITITAYDAATTYQVGIPSVTAGKVVSTLGTGGTTATTASALQVLLAASEEPEFQEIEWSVASSTITGIRKEAGSPFTAVSAVSGGAGTIGAVTTTVANSSKNDLGNAKNYSSNSVPVNGDTLVFELSDVDALYNLETTFATVDLAAVIVRSTFTGRIGAPLYNGSGSAAYREYRGTTLTMQTCTALTVELPANAFAEQFKFNVGATACTALIRGSGGGFGNECVWWKGTHAANVVTLDGGSIVVAPVTGDTAVIATLRAINASVRVNAGVTLASNLLTNSLLVAYSNVATVTMEGDGSALVSNDAITATTLTVNEGTVSWNSSGTITTVTLGTGARLDFSGDRRAKTVTNAIAMHTGSSLNDPDGIVTYSGGIQLTRCRLSEVSIELGNNRLLGSVS